MGHRYQQLKLGIDANNRIQNYRLPLPRQPESDSHVGFKMNKEIITIGLAAWGALTGTVAILVQLLSFLCDRARLSVKATMSYGSSLYHGRQQEHCMRVTLTNRGRRVVRIERIALRMANPMRVALNRGLMYRGWNRNVVQGDIGIYSAQIDPIEDTVRNPDIRTYPPREINLDEHQTKEIELVVSDNLVTALPAKRGVLIVTDQVGRRYRARYLPINFLKSSEEKPTTPSTPTK